MLCEHSPVTGYAVHIASVASTGYALSMHAFDATRPTVQISTQETTSRKSSVYHTDQLSNPAARAFGVGGSIDSVWSCKQTA